MLSISLLLVIFSNFADLSKWRPLKPTLVITVLRPNIGANTTLLIPQNFKSISISISFYHLPWIDKSIFSSGRGCVNSTVPSPGWAINHETSPPKTILVCKEYIISKFSLLTRQWRSCEICDPLLIPNSEVLQCKFGYNIFYDGQKWWF